MSTPLPSASVAVVSGKRMEGAAEELFDEEITPKEEAHVGSREKRKEMKKKMSEGNERRRQ